MPTNFRIGDIIRGLKGAGQYGYATEHATMEVINVRKDRDDIEVRILTQAIHPNEIGKEYYVNSEYFELVKKRLKPVVIIVG